jgi:hypothetical protein
MKKAAAPDPLLIGVIIVLTLWQFFWKGVALWRTSQLKQRNWFIALFILVPFNDLGIVELIYLFWFAKKRITFAEIKSWFKRGN